MATSVLTPVFCTLPPLKLVLMEETEDSCADLKLIARAVAAKQLIEQILEVDGGVLVAGGVEIGKVVGNGVERRVAGVQSGEWNGKVRH